MYTINPTATANQEFNTFIGGVEYGFRLHLFRGMLYADVSVDGTVIARSVRCIDREWLFPVHPKGMAGNFRFESDRSGVYPDYEKFGDSCRIVFYTNEEIAALDE